MRKRKNRVRDGTFLRKGFHIMRSSMMDNLTEKSHKECGNLDMMRMLDKMGITVRPTAVTIGLSCNGSIHHNTKKGLQGHTL